MLFNLLLPKAELHPHLCRWGVMVVADRANPAVQRALQASFAKEGVTLSF